MNQQKKNDKTRIKIYVDGIDCDFQWNVCWAGIEMNCKVCNKELDEVDMGIYETTKKRVCYDCTMGGKTINGRKSNKDIETLRAKYG